MADVRVEKTGEDVALAAMDAVRVMAGETIDARGRFVVALAGGSTPKRLYELLGERMKDAIDWAKVVVTFGDDRCVPPDHEMSNFRMATEAMLSHVPVGKTVRVEGDDGDHHSATKRFHENLSEALGGEPIDLVLLGMGDDGHTASLFPGDDGTNAGSLAVAVEAPPTSPIKNRVSLTYDAIAAARAVIVLVTGEKKADRLREVLSGESDLPMARVVKQRSGNVTFIVDEAAASG